ncbi:MAG: MFS transporter, partial [Deltaproteobacteria bacterium]|nr:MFS transporter [Deltaproteobacteria bacterium]
AMSIFAVGGNVGFAVGPALTTGALLLWGLKGTLILVVPVTIMALVLVSQRSAFTAMQLSSPRRQAESAPSLGQDEWFPFIRLSGAVICRSIIFYGLNTFLPLYWIHVFNQSKAAGGTALSILFGTGIVATLLGGRLADRYGHRKIVLAGFGALIPLLFIFITMDNVNGATALLIPIGFALFASFSPMIVMGQRYLPNRVGLASGITLGVAVSVGGIVAPLFGRIADNHGIPAALTGVAAFSIIALLLAFTLPAPRLARKKQ